VDYLLLALSSNEPIYAVIDGNHRAAAMLLIAEANVSGITLDTPISVVPHKEEAPINLCRAVSALLNEAHLMGRTSSFVDSLSYMHDTLRTLVAAGCRVQSAKALTDELRSAGVNIVRGGVGNIRPREMKSQLTEHHVRQYWEWINLLNDEGVARLVELQNMDAKSVWLTVQGEDPYRGAEWKGYTHTHTHDTHTHTHTHTRHTHTHTHTHI
jgi:hypothetical protein